MGLLSRARDKESHDPEAQITQFCAANPDFHCIVFELSEGLKEMVDKAGTVISLPLNRSLVLLPIAMDRELIAHRLSKNLSTKPLLSFEENSPENVLRKIDSLL
jgi:hypothetical protein